MKRAVFALLVALAPLGVLAQHSSYSGQERREIKALSAEEVEQYLAGAGMGFARAAELNRFPGPMHVLELSDQLKLSAEQRESAQRLMDRHKAEARVIGAKLVEAERALDKLFASGSVAAPELASHVKAVATLQGDYRLSHLETHRQMKAILSREQVDRYDALRGYTGAGSGGGHPRHH
jgi:Spy/CpxP family protein refolding chaperone